jgi:hypothetical protein
VTRSDFDPEGHPNLAGVTYVCSVDDPPAIEGAEIHDVCQATKNCIVDELRDYDLPAINELHQHVFGRYSVLWDEFHDRTISVALMDLRAIRYELMVALQSHVLARWPLWRIWICDDGDPDEGILVYPDAVVAGSASPDQPTSGAIQQWQIFARVRWERRFGPMRRQIAWVEAALASALAEMGHHRFHAVCACDNYDGDFERHSLWAIQTFPPNHAVLSGIEEWGHSAFGPVVPGPRLGRRGSTVSDGVVAAIYIVPPTPSHVCDVGQLNDDYWTHHVSLPLITDKELQAWEARRSVAP